MSGHRFGVNPAVVPARDRTHVVRARTSTSSERTRLPGDDGERATSRFRIAHVALLGQGLVVGILGGVALAWSMANLHFGPEGMPILGLAVTPLHGGLLMAGGALAILACLGRWTTMGFSLIAAAGWSTLTVVCAIEAAHRAPGILGFDPRDTLMYAALGVYNLALCTWLAPAMRAGSG